MPKTNETFSINPTRPQLLPVCFHNYNLSLAVSNQEPFVPMRPVVEGMGLDWKTQYRKINTNKERWGVVIMTMPSAGGKQRSVCLPLRKLPGFLATINPLKLKNELRSRIVLFQNECDDVLWDYWNRMVKKELPTEVKTITPSQQRDIQKAVSSKVKSIDGGQKEFKSVYNTLNDYFGVPRYTEIQHEDFDRAIKFIDKITLKPTKTREEDVNIDSIIVKVLPKVNKELKWEALLLMTSGMVGVRHTLNYEYPSLQGRTT